VLLQLRYKSHIGGRNDKNLSVLYPKGILKLVIGLNTDQNKLEYTRNKSANCIMYKKMSLKDIMFIQSM